MALWMSVWSSGLEVLQPCSNAGCFEARILLQICQCAISLLFMAARHQTFTVSMLCNEADPFLSDMMHDVMYAQVRTSEERMQQLRAELLLREENYNKHFKNGGAGEKVLSVGAAMNAQAGVMDWMLKKNKESAHRKGSGRTT